MKFFIFFILTIFCISSSAEVLEENLQIFFTSPVSSTEAHSEIEQKVADTLKVRCPGQSLQLKSLYLDIPFGDDHGVAFHPNGEAGNLVNPFFIYYSYPKVSAKIRYICVDKRKSAS